MDYELSGLKDVVEISNKVVEKYKDDYSNLEKPYLYHYTSQKGLLGIFEKKNFHMTDILYLNDSKEFTYSFELIKLVLNEKISEFEKSNPKLLGHEFYIKIKDFSKTSDYETKYIIWLKLKEYIEYKMYNHGHQHYFVFSLSEKDDDLNQWRGYCPSIGGFCIEIDLNKMSDKLSGNLSNTIKKCIYNEEEQRVLIDKVFNDIYQSEKKRL